MANCTNGLKIHKEEQQKIYDGQVIVEGRKVLFETLATSRIVWLEDRILVLPDQVSDTFTGTKLFKPDITKAAEKATRGTILAAGPGRHIPERGYVDNERKAGERIIFGHYAGIEFEEDGVKYRVMRPEDVYGVLPSE